MMWCIFYVYCRICSRVCFSCSHIMLYVYHHRIQRQILYRIVYQGCVNLTTIDVIDDLGGELHGVVGSGGGS